MATLPSVTTQTTGAVAGAAWANSVKDGIDFLVGAGVSNSRPIMKARRTTAQTLATGAYTAINMTTEDLDTDSGHSTATNPSRYTANLAGWYDVIGALTFDAGVSALRVVGIRKNGTGSTPPDEFTTPMVLATAERLTVPGFIYLAVGDWVEVCGFQSTGGNLDVLSGSMTVKWVTV